MRSARFTGRSMSKTGPLPPAIDSVATAAVVAPSRPPRIRNNPPADEKVIFERLWKGTFRAIVAASMQARDQEVDSFRRTTSLRSVISVKESHQMAEANQEKNIKMREALGISQFFVEGSSLDPEHKAREAAAAATAEAQKKKYTLVPDSSPSPEREGPAKEKKKKSASSKRSDDSPVAKKHKSLKKHKRDRAC